MDRSRRGLAHPFTPEKASAGPFFPRRTGSSALSGGVLRWSGARGPGWRWIC